MISLSQWAALRKPHEKSWLLLGKGPSFETLTSYDITEYSTIAINHTVRHVSHVECASAIDISVVKDCISDIRRNANYLLMPRFPHEDADVVKVPPTRPLESYFDEISELRDLSDEGRLVWYNLSSGPDVSDEEQIPTGAFSAEVLVNLLAVAGVRRIRTIGIDGGKFYAPSFQDLQDKTLLANGQPSFDVQTNGIARAMLRFNMDYAPMNQEEPIRVYIGADESQMLGARVLEYSIKSHCPMSFEFDTMQDVNPPLPREKKNQPRTQFSFRRFAIPEKAGFRGKAVYLDADMQVFRDFRELWDIPFKDASILYAPSSSPDRPSQFSVLLLDCAALKWDVKEIVHSLDEGEYDYDGLMKELCIVEPHKVQDRIPSQWNSLEQFVPGSTGLIHYTDMHTQPWVYARNKNGDVWVTALQEAIYDGFISWEEVNQAVKNGYARPSLAVQLKVSRRLWKLFNKTVARVLDARFHPHAALQKRISSTSP